MNICCCDIHDDFIYKHVPNVSYNFIEIWFKISRESDRSVPLASIEYKFESTEIVHYCFTACNIYYILHTKYMKLKKQ